MFDKTLSPFAKPLLSKMAIYLVKIGVSADAVSILGFITGIVAAFLVGYGHFLLALLFFSLNRILDGLDGAIARVKIPTHRGAFLDIVFDFIIYSSIPFAFAVFNDKNSFVACFIIFSFVGTGSSFLAYGILQEKVSKINKKPTGEKSFYYLSGLIEGSETIFFIVLILLFPSLFFSIGIFFGCLCWCTTIFRIYSGWRDFSLK